MIRISFPLLSFLLLLTASILIAHSPMAVLLTSRDISKSWGFGQNKGLADVIFVNNTAERHARALLGARNGLLKLAMDVWAYPLVAVLKCTSSVCCVHCMYTNTEDTWLAIYGDKNTVLRIPNKHGYQPACKEAARWTPTLSPAYVGIDCDSSQLLLLLLRGRRKMCRRSIRGDSWTWVGSCDRWGWSGSVAITIQNYRQKWHMIWVDYSRQEAEQPRHAHTVLFMCIQINCCSLDENIFICSSFFYFPRGKRSTQLIKKQLSKIRTQTKQVI